MKLTDEELDAILHEGGLRLAQPYSPRGSYRKDGWLFTQCEQCGVEAHYRLAYILHKNGIHEHVCRACYWLDWYAGTHDLRAGVIQSLLDQGYDLDTLIDDGMVIVPKAIGDEEACGLAEEHGYELVDLIRGARKGDDVMLVRCRACGRQSAMRPADVSFGCTCSR